MTDEEGNFRTEDYFLRKGLDRNDLFILHEIYLKLPITWKNRRQNDISNIYSFELLSSKMFYNIFIGTIQDVFVSKHAEVLGLNLDNTEVATCFLNPIICTLDGKVREFQYKLLHSIIFCNDKLNQFGLVQSNLCSFCEMEIETYSHIFFKCSEVINIWKEVGNQLKLFQLRNLQWIDVLLGFRDNMKDNALINHVIILVKYLIYVSRKMKKFPTSADICKEILVDISRKIEYEKATLKGKLEIHFKKWENFTL